jgi:hypothetical protein
MCVQRRGVIAFSQQRAVCIPACLREGAPFAARSPARRASKRTRLHSSLSTLSTHVRTLDLDTNPQRTRLCAPQKMTQSGGTHDKIGRSAVLFPSSSSKTSKQLKTKPPTRKVYISGINPLYIVRTEGLNDSPRSEISSALLLLLSQVSFLSNFQALRIDLKTSVAHIHLGGKSCL